MKKDLEGINLFCGLQGVGKTYVCTNIAVRELMKNGNGKKVISNYPIIFQKPLTKKQRRINWILRHKYIYKLYKLIFKRELEEQIGETISSLKWEDRYTAEAIKDAMVLIDESSDRYTGVYAHEFNKDDRRFFTKIRHNNVVVLLMAQSHEDVHPFITRKITWIHTIRKRKYIWNKNPSSFLIETYASVKDYLKKDEHKHNKKAKKTLYDSQRIKFDKLTGNAYMTHYFRDIRDEPEYQSWYELIETDQHKK